MKMSVISKCCKAEIETRYGREFPDGGTWHYIDTKWPACSKCGEEHPEEVNACEECGDVAEGLGTLCKDCASAEVL